MKPEERSNWRGEDYEFQREFEDVSEILREVTTDAAPVPVDLDRRIKELASGQVTEELEGHWLFGGIPQLSMAVSLMFAIAVVFVVSVEQDDNESRAALTGAQPMPEYTGVREERAVEPGKSAEPRRAVSAASRSAEQVAAESVVEREADYATVAAQPTAMAPQSTAAAAEATSMAAQPTALTELVANEYVLLEEIDPVYPQRALQQGLIGWVLTKFTISADGVVQQPVITDTCAVQANGSADQICAEHDNAIFNDAALEAVRQFRYRPRSVAGRAVAVEGVEYRVSFVLPSVKQDLRPEE
jgi:hypothetical protein|tara:strand:+ start:5722 stop:6624 length:903 start_codon:yes stop_codon:yes gene_type:complete